MRAVGIFWGVGVGVMHSVKNRISSRREVGAALPNPGEEIEELFPVFAHHKHLMGGIAVKEETLAKQGEIPVKQEEDNDNHSILLLNVSTNIRLKSGQFFIFTPMKLVERS